MHHKINKTIFTVLMASVLILASGGLLRGGIYEKAGTYGAQFLLIPVGARPAALGGAFVAVSGDPTSIYWNPAGLSGLSALQLGLFHNKWFSDVTRQSAFAAYPTPAGVFGAGLTYLHMGEIVGFDVDEYGEPFRISNFTCYDLAGTVSYAKAIALHTSVGANLKVIQESLADYRALGFGVDAGLLFCVGDFLGPGAWYPVRNITVGCDIKNLGVLGRFITKTEKFPLEVNVGLAARLLGNSIIVLAEVDKPVDGEYAGHFGLEWALRDILTLRAGYDTANEFGSGITCGVGIKISDWVLDYAYVPYSDLGETHRVGIQVSIGTIKEEASVKATENHASETVGVGSISLVKPGEESLRELVTISDKQSDMSSFGLGTKKDTNHEGDGVPLLLKRTIHFDFNSYDLRPSEISVLDEVAEFILDNGRCKVEVHGHADDVGNDTANQRVSLMRADAVRNYFVMQWYLPPEMFLVYAHGSKEPVVSSELSNEKALNRRVEIKILAQ